jgi:hypothetical protein
MSLKIRLQRKMSQWIFCLKYYSVELELKYLVYESDLWKGISVRKKSVIISYFSNALTIEKTLVLLKFIVIS